MYSHKSFIDVLSETAKCICEKSKIIFISFLIKNISIYDYFQMTVVFMYVVRGEHLIKNVMLNVNMWSDMNDSNNTII